MARALHSIEIKLRGCLQKKKENPCNMQKKMLDLNYKHSNKKTVKIQNSHLHINTIY